MTQQVIMQGSIAAIQGGSVFPWLFLDTAHFTDDGYSQRSTRVGLHQAFSEQIITDYIIMMSNLTVLIMKQFAQSDLCISNTCAKSHETIQTSQLAGKQPYRRQLDHKNLSMALINLQLWTMQLRFIVVPMLV